MSTLFAHTAVWRVVEIEHTLSTIEGKSRALTGRIAYRWTRKGAERLRDRWAREAAENYSRSGFVVQNGVVHWVPDDEWDNAVEATEWSREQNVDDRDQYGPSVTWGPVPRLSQPQGSR